MSVNANKKPSIRKPKSLRRALIGKFLFWLFAIDFVAGSALAIYVHKALVRQFDDDLLRWLQTVTGYSTGLNENDFLSEYSRLSVQSHSPDTIYFQVWDDYGNTLTRSPSLEKKDLPRLKALSHTPVFENIALDNEKTFRAAAIHTNPGPNQIRKLVVVARSRDQLDARWRIILISGMLLGFVLPIGTALIVRWVVIRGLSPLNQIAEETSSIDADNLTHRFPSSGLPAELVPICKHLNGLLSRLDEAFIRERRFTGDVSHKLSVPTSELRTLSEAGISLDLGDDPRPTFKQLVEISQQMQQLVSNLLTIVRCESGSLFLLRESVDLGDIMGDVWHEHTVAADNKTISTSLVGLDEPMTASVDRELMASTVDLLFDNAISHCPAGGKILVNVRQLSDSWAIKISNTNEFLTADDIERVFEPFWKKTNNDVSHNGIGLALVSAYARLMNFSVVAQLTNDDLFTIEMRPIA